MAGANTVEPSWAVAYAGSVGRAALAARTTRQRLAAGPRCEHKGRSVFTPAGSLARKAEAHQRNRGMAATNGGYVVRISDIWGPDPWRPHPV